MTTSIERVRIALAHREPDRVPLDIGGTRVTGIHLKAYRAYRRGLGLAASDPSLQVRYLQLPKVEADFRSRLGVDIESVDPLTDVEDGSVAEDATGRRYADRWGREWLMPEGGAYFDVCRFPLANAQSPEEVERYPWPREDSPAILGNLAHEAKTVWADHQRAIMLGRTCAGIFEMFQSLCGYEKAMLDLSLNPSFCEALLDK